MPPFPDLPHEVHEVLDELDDLPAPAGDAAGDAAAPAELEGWIARATPALDALAVTLASRLVDATREVLRSASDDPDRDPPRGAPVSQAFAELARLDEVRQNPTLALVQGHPDRERRARALEGARALAEREGDRVDAPDLAWAWNSTEVLISQLLRPTPGARLAELLARRAASARAAAPREIRALGQLVDTLVRAAFLPAAHPGWAGRGSLADPSLARLRLAVYRGADLPLRAAALGADRPELGELALEVLAGSGDDEDTAIDRFAAAARARPAAASAGPQQPRSVEAGDPPLRKITTWRVLVFLALVAASLYAYLLR